MNFKTLAKEILRWIVIAATGGYGVWQVIYAVSGVLRWKGDFVDLIFLLIFPLVVATPFFVVAYICLHRKYRKLFLILGVIGTIVIFGELSALPEKLGIFQFMDRHIHENHSFAFLGLPIAFFSFFGPIYAAAWFFRWCHRLSYPLSVRAKFPKTKATRSFVWLGVLCLASTLIPMLGAFNQMMQSPNAPISSESISKSFDWVIGLTAIGGLLMFLGLVRRQPIANTPDSFSSNSAKTCCLPDRQPSTEC